MCGIAGMVDLSGQREPEMARLSSMAKALVHRGPDEEGFHCGRGIGLASRRLSIMGISDGQQPMRNEDGRCTVVFNGELFDHPEQRVGLRERGHILTTHCDTEIIPHLWEE